MNLPEKMKTGSNVLSVSKYINAIIDCLAVMRLSSDMKTIRLNETAGGTTISVINQKNSASGTGAASESYAGPFAIVADSETLDKYKCVNNTLLPEDQLLDPAGGVYFGYVIRNVDPITGIELGDIVWIEAKYENSDYVATLNHGVALPGDVEGTVFYIVGTVGATIDQQLKTNLDLRFVAL
jgi:hypothetical protein